jgi:mono/diheme cytochrome c family protein
MYKNHILFLVITLVLITAGCDRSNNNPGWDYFPDMFYSKAYETDSENPNFKDRLTMREPVEGTIPREMMVFPYEKTDEDRIRAGKDLRNPFDTLSPELLNRGHKVYTTFCIDCHGEKGDGKGFLFTSGKYPFPPASLISDKAKNLAEGEIFHTITVGFGVMGAHGSQIRPDDRWKAILYIRKELQQK